MNSSRTPIGLKPSLGLRPLTLLHLPFVTTGSLDSLILTSLLLITHSIPFARLFQRHLSQSLTRILIPPLLRLPLSRSGNFYFSLKPYSFAHSKKLPPSRILAASPIAFAYSIRVTSNLSTPMPLISLERHLLLNKPKLNWVTHLTMTQALSLIPMSLFPLAMLLRPNALRIWMNIIVQSKPCRKTNRLLL